MCIFSNDIHRLSNSNMVKVNIHGEIAPHVLQNPAFYILVPDCKHHHGKNDQIAAKIKLTITKLFPFKHFHAQSNNHKYA